MVVVIAYLQSQGISVYPYLADWLLAVDSREVLLQHIDQTLTLLASFEIRINYWKSHLTPAQLVQFIKAILDSNHARAFLPPDRASKIVGLVHTITSGPARALQIQCLLGHMASTISVIPIAKLRM